MAGDDARRAQPPARADEPDVLDSPLAGHKAISGGALRALAYATGILVGLVSAPVMIRYLGVVSYGRYVAVVSLVTVAAGVTEAGVNAIALREITNRDATRRARVMGELIGMRIVLTCAGVAGAIAIGALVGYDQTLRVGILLVGFGLLLQVLQTLLEVVLQGRMRFGWSTTLDVLRPVMSAGLLIVLALAHAPFELFFWTSIPSGLLVLALVVVLVRRLMPIRPSFRIRGWGVMLRETLPYAVTVAVNVVYFRLAIVVMSVISNGHQTGYFATSFRATEVLIGIPAVAVSAAFPIVARAASADHRRLADASQRLLEVGLVAGIGMAVCIALGATFVMHVLGGAEVAPAAPVLRIQGLALIATWVTTAVGFPLLALRRYRILLVANLGALAVSLVLVFVLVPQFGAKGGAAATSAAEAIAAVILVAGLSRHIHLSLRTLPVVALAGGLALAVGGLLPVSSLLSVGIGIVVYAGVLFATGSFPTELRHAATPLLARLGLDRRSDTRSTD
jgi:O-antigen/teichoic acid export membrane protein